MPKQFNTGAPCKAMGLVLICAFFSGCSTYNKIYQDNDIVYSTGRFELKYHYRDWNRRTPIIFFTQSLVKETDRDNNSTYRAYDMLFLTSTSFRPEEKVILIVDNKPYPMIIDKIEFESEKTLSENTTDISTSDSTTVTVITGFSENNRKISRFSYNIPISTINAIRESNHFFIRYYSGPSMITIKPRKSSIKKIKKLIDA